MSGIPVQVAFGDGFVSALVPERTRVLEPPAPLPPLYDPAAAFLEALRTPIDHEPLARLAGPKAKVTIAFDDPVMPVEPLRAPDFRELAIPILLEELERHGVSHQDVRLLCANALHRQWTTGELATILGRKLAYTWSPARLACHDAEDPNAVVTVGETARGFPVEVNRAVLDSDLFIYLSLPQSPFNGGWKSTVVGLSTWRSIRQHHRPFPFAAGKSVMDHHRSTFPKLMREMGAVLETELVRRGRRVFQVEAVLNNARPQEVSAVFAGAVDAVHERALAVLERQQVTRVQGQSDVLIYGVPNRDHYCKLSLMNPICVRNWGLSYSFGRYRNRPVVREGGILILANPCIRQFHRVHHPSYVELFEELLPRTRDPFELWDTYAEDFAHRPEYVHRYRYGHGFHGAHPLILWGQGEFAFRHCGRILMAGPTDPEVAERLDFEPFPTVEEAVAEAERTLGKDCSITFAPRPPEYITEVH